MSTHKIGFCGEIRKLSLPFGCKKCRIWSYVLTMAPLSDILFYIHKKMVLIKVLSLVNSVLHYLQISCSAELCLKSFIALGPEQTL